MWGVYQTLRQPRAWLCTACKKAPRCCDTTPKRNTSSLHCSLLWPGSKLLAALCEHTKPGTPVVRCAGRWQQLRLKQSCVVGFLFFFFFFCPRLPVSIHVCANAITHASMHVRLCDNAGPVWQAPRIIALGRELHNNVGLWFGAVLPASGPVKSVAPCVCVCVCSRFTRTHIENLWEIDGRPSFFFCFVFSTAFTSHSDGEIVASDKNPYRFLYLKDNNALGVPVNRAADFSKCFWPMRAVDGRRSNSTFCATKCMPGQTRCQNRRSHVLPACYYRSHTGKKKQNNLTHPKCLFTWPPCCMSSREVFFVVSFTFFLTFE